MAQAQGAESATEEQSAPRRPELTIRHGNVEIAGWRNRGSKGDFFTTSPPLHPRIATRMKQGKGRTEQFQPWTIAENSVDS